MAAAAADSTRPAAPAAMYATGLFLSPPFLAGGGLGGGGRNAATAAWIASGLNLPATSLIAASRL